MNFKLNNTIPFEPKRRFARAKRPIALLLIFTFIAPVLPVHAGLDDEMRSMFQGMVNVTPADAYIGQRRGVVSLGSIEARSRIVNPQIVNFTPPSIKAGCGGISVFGGSFSFINAQQFQELMRAVAQNAAGYAFGLALEAMCPMCAGEMKRLQKIVQDLNGKLGDSCSLAKGLVDNSIGPSLAAVQESNKQDASAIATAFGGVNDFLEGLGRSNNNRASPIDNAKAAGRINDLKGNVVYRSLLKSNTASWFAFGQMNEVLMSVSGTITVTEGQGQDLNGAPEGTALIYNSFAPLIGMKELLEGGTVRLYTCDSVSTVDLTTACLNPVPTSQNLKGMRVRVKEMLMGANGSTGIIAKITGRSGAQAFTAEEKAFTEAAARTGVLALLRQFAEDPTAARVAADLASDAIASEMAANLVAEMMFTIRAAVTGAQRPLDSSMLAALRDRTSEINEERKRLAAQIQSINGVFQTSTYLREKLRDATGRTPGANALAKR